MTWDVEFTCVRCGHRADDMYTRDWRTWLCGWCEAHPIRSRWVWLRRALGIAVLLLWAVPAFAQTEPQVRLCHPIPCDELISDDPVLFMPETLSKILGHDVLPRPMPTAHKVGLSVYATSAALDYHSTYRNLSIGGHERNPLGKLTHDSPAGTVMVGAAIDATATVLLYKWLGKDHPKLTTGLLYAVSAVRVGVAVTNYREPR